MFTFIIIFVNIPASATTISLDNDIDVPDRTVTYEDRNYEIQEIGAYHLDEPVNISVDVSGISSFQLSLLDKNRSFLWNHMVYHTDGHSEMTMPPHTVNVPGTYAFAVLYQGNILAAKPVVFSQYELTATPDISVIQPGGTLHVEIKVVPDPDMPVKVVLAKKSSSLEYETERAAEGIFRTDIKIPYSASGNFSLYSAVISEDKLVMGYPELIGVSGDTIIEVRYPVDESKKEVDPVQILVFIVLLSAFIIIISKKRWD